jgi:hypothetical protein
MEKKLIFISFKNDNDKYNSFIDVDSFLSTEDDIELITKKAASIYSNLIIKMKDKINEIETYRRKRCPLPTRKIWELGDIIFKLVEDLNELNLQIDGIYNHLERDLNVKRKWLEKVIILRRYVPEETMIPEYLNWSKCEKGTRRVAEQIKNGIIPK